MPKKQPLSKEARRVAAGLSLCSACDHPASLHGELGCEHEEPIFTVSGAGDDGEDDPFDTCECRGTLSQTFEGEHVLTWLLSEKPERV